MYGATLYEQVVNCQGVPLREQTRTCRSAACGEVSPRLQLPYLRRETLMQRRFGYGGRGRTFADGGRVPKLLPATSRASLRTEISALLSE